MTTFNKVRTLCILLLSQLFITLTVYAEQTFEQAYAPIDVSGITIFIPIELIPNSTNRVSLKASGNSYLLEWAAISDATYYKVEHKVNGVWVTLNNKVTANSYTASINHGPEFRVITCHRYGCSTGQHVNNSVNVPVSVRSFTASNYQVNQSQTTRLSWDVAGASNVRLTSNKGYTNDSLSLRGSLNVSISDLTHFTLTASGFGQNNSQYLSVVKVVAQPQASTPKRSAYIQPLYDLNLQPIERSLISNANGASYVADIKNKFYKVSSNSVIEAELNLAGMMANKALIVDNYFYYGLSVIDGSGQICKTSLDFKFTQCLSVAHNVVAAPVIMDDVNAVLYARRLFAIDVKGIIHELDIYNFSLKSSTEITGLNGAALNILSTPAVDHYTQQLIFRLEDSLVDIMTISTDKLKSAISSTQTLTQSVRKFFSSPHQSFIGNSKINSLTAPSNNASSVLLTPSEKQETVTVNWSKKLD